jgi:hypothetical protein
MRHEHLSTGLFSIALACILSWQTTRAQTEPTSSPATQLSLPAGPLKVRISAIQGLVQHRAAADQKWQKSQVGVELNEGAELRTGPRSAVQFVIGNDQTVTLDRLGTLQILRANLENGKVFSDLGMKYGRTRYDIESAAREHDAKVRTPSSVLAVRGTQFSAYDQPPFAPESVSLDGRVLFKDAKKLVAFGGRGQGKTRINANASSSAQQARSDATINPFGEFSAQTGTDLARLAGVSSYAAYGQTGQLIERIRRGEISGTFFFALPVQEELHFDLSWIGVPNSDVDLTIVSPKNEILSGLSGQQTSVASGGFHQGDNVADFPVLGPTGEPVPGKENLRVGNESALWPISYPPGTYTIKLDLDPRTGKTADYTINASRNNPQKDIFVNILSQQGTLTAGMPSATFSVTATGPPPTSSTRVRSKR